MKRIVKLAVQASLLLVVLSGCGRQEYGDLFFRVWFDQSALSGSCAAGNQLGTTTIYDAATFAVYQGAADSYFLDLYDTVIEGSRTADNYVFMGREVNFVGAGDSDTTDLMVDFTVSGEDVTGIQVMTETFSYSSDNCVESTTFSGIKVDDVELRRGI